LGRGGIGVAPGAEWFACVNLQRNVGSPGEYLNCMQYMLAPYPRGGDPFRDGDPSRAAHVMNDSWGCPPFEGCDANALRPAAEALRAAGIYVVASAGNEGPFCGSVSDPIAIYDSVFAVGAVDQAGNVTAFSSRGPVKVDGSNRPKPDLLAPGKDILSSFPGGTYQREQGTSMAGPHVAGVVALMWSANPKLIGDVDGTSRILRETARPYQGAKEGCFSGDRPNNAYGYGLLDAYAAVKRAQEAR
ncbi:MAG: S8 family serine peptidase, partial [Chloroflexota bacterium]